MTKEIHHMFANYPILDELFSLIINIFLAPGRWMLQSLAATPWGHEWGITVTWAGVALVALFFWCVLFNLLMSADASIDRFLKRYSRDRNEAKRWDDRQHELDQTHGKRIDVR